MKIVIKKLIQKIFPNWKSNKKEDKNKQKWVTFFSINETNDFKYGWSYIAQKEDDDYYWFNFNGKTIRYPKGCFIEGLNKFI